MVISFRKIFFHFLFLIRFICGSGNFTFISVGDWGGAAVGQPYTTNVYAVANSMANYSQHLNPQFIINTGDNFYWCGIQ
jgi:hypothetical protein